MVCNTEPREVAMVDKRTADERREYLREYRARPENMEKERIRSRERMKSGRSTPEGRAKSNEYHKRWREKNQDKVKASLGKYNEANRVKRLRSYSSSSFKKRYGITIDQRDELFASQRFACAACGITTNPSKKFWHIDHCHTTGRVRGILCANCNIALGQVSDNIDHLRKLITYLEGNHA